jgi:oxygen-independent coproporphyrinogen III oxidase
MSDGIIRSRHRDRPKRFDRPGPRYTSYPTAVEFTEAVGEARTGSAGGRTPTRRAAEPVRAPAVLRAPLPVLRLPRGHHAPHAGGREVPEYLKKEIDLLAERLPDRRSLVQMHWGGGTPTYYSPAQLRDLFEHVRKYFDFVDGAEIALEVDPRVTSRDHLETLWSWASTV